MSSNEIKDLARSRLVNLEYKTLNAFCRMVTYNWKHNKDELVKYFVILYYLNDLEMQGGDL